jgi:hypothetical protein
MSGRRTADHHAGPYRIEVLTEARSSLFVVEGLEERRLEGVDVAHRDGEAHLSGVDQLGEGVTLGRHDGQPGPDVVQDPRPKENTVSR